jgi:hypothetical protein
MSGVVLADGALRAGCCRSDLDQVLADCRDWPGISAARATIAFANPLSESVLESISRVDFLWPDQRVIGEADGLAKYKDILDLHAEKLRQERLERAGWTVVRWTWDAIWTNSAGTAERVRAALRRGADLAGR